MEAFYNRITHFEKGLYNHINNKILKCSFISTFIISLLVNGFAYFNLIPQHDSLNYTFEFAGNWEISLGRFLLPVYGEFQGHITIPWIIGILTIIFITCIVYLVCIVLDFDSTWQILAVSSVLSANVCLIELTSVFMYATAAYMLSVMFSCLGVCFLLKSHNKYKYLFAILSFVISMGLYQAEIVFAICLIAIIAINDLMANMKFSELLKKYLPIAMILLISVTIYFLIHKFTLKAFNLTPPDSYNSLGNLTDIHFSSLILSIKDNYIAFFEFFFGEECFTGPTVTRFCNILLCVSSLVILVKQMINNKLYFYNVIFIILVILLFPGVVCIMNIVMMKTSLRFYMLYSLLSVYLLFLSIINKSGILADYRYFGSLFKRCVSICFSLILLQNIIFSNQIYSYQKIVYDRTVSVMTRILGDVEAHPKYEIGETEVVVVGALNNNKYIKKALVINEDLPGTLQKNMRLRELVKRTRFNGGKLISATYGMTFDAFAYLLGSEINYVNDSTITSRYREKEEVADMPVYPKDGYYKIIDGRMVIKLS